MTPSEAKVNLKSTHYNELVNYLEKFNPEAAKQVEKKNQEIESKKRQYQREEKELEAKLAAELDNFEQSQKIEMDEKLRLEEEKLDIELQKEREKLMANFEQELKKQENEKLAAAQKEKEIEEAKKRGATEDEMRSILENWSENEDKALQEQKLLQIQRKQEIDARLRARKQRHIEAVSEKLEEEKEIKKKEIELNNIEEKAQVLAEIDQVDNKKTEQAVSVIETIVDEKPVVDSVRPLTEDQFEAKLKASSLIQTLNLLKSHLPNDSIEELYTTDEFSTDILPCLSADLDRQEKITLKFARCISGLLSALELIRPISVLVAKSFPKQSSLKANPFLHAYTYDSVNRILYLRRSFLRVVRNFYFSIKV